MTEDTHFTTFVKTESGSAKFVFRLPLSFVLQFRVSLFCTKGPHAGQELPNYVFFYRDQSKIVFETRLNFSGTFLITFFCRHQPIEELDEDEAEMITYCEFASYRLICDYKEPKKSRKVIDGDAKVVAVDARERLLGPQRSAMEYLKLSFIDHESGYFTAPNNGMLTIRIYGAEPLHIRYEITKEKESYRKFCTLTLGDADDRNHSYFRCRFPDAGEYFLKFYGMNPTDDNPDWLMFAFYMIRVPHACKRKHFSAKCTAGYYGLSPLIDKSLLVSHKNPFFVTKDNKLLMTFYHEESIPDMRFNLSYFDLSHSTKGQMVPVNNLMLFDKFLPQKRHYVQCEVEMMSPGIHVLEISRRIKTTKMVPKPIDADEELLKILDDINDADNASSMSGFLEEQMMEVTEVEEEFMMTYGIHYMGAEIPNSEVNEFPDILSSWTGACKLFEPRMRFLPALKTTLFRLAVPWAQELRVKGRSVTPLDLEKRGVFSFNILVGMYSESVVVQAKPFLPEDSECDGNNNDFVDLLRFEVSKINTNITTFIDCNSTKRVN